jgi:hypothetical protein
MFKQKTCSKLVEESDFKMAKNNVNIKIESINVILQYNFNLYCKITLMLV